MLPGFGEKSWRKWRKEYPEVTLEHMLVDNCAMQLVKDPKQFDVILTENMFGDICPMSQHGDRFHRDAGKRKFKRDKVRPLRAKRRFAPDIAGKGIANPIATILSAAMMLRFSLISTKKQTPSKTQWQKY